MKYFTRYLLVHYSFEKLRLDLVETLKELNPKMKPPLFEDERPGDIHTSVADISRLIQTLTIGEMTTLKEGLS